MPSRSVSTTSLKDAPILLLDEATASLDSITEQRVQQALDQFARGRTTLVFAHEPRGGAVVWLV